MFNDVSSSINNFEDAINQMMLCFLGADTANYSQGDTMQGIPVKKSKINKHSLQKADKI